MNLINYLRYLRHGPLKRFNRFWILLGSIYRKLMHRMGLQTIARHKIGPYGPFALDGEFQFSNFSQWGGQHNRAFTACIEACRGKHCVLDVGAHIGLVALPMSKVIAKEGQVHCFEPAAKNLTYLKRHILLNQANNIHICEQLVGDSVANNIGFFEQERSATGMNSIAPRTKHEKKYRKTVKQQTTIDAYCKEHHLAPEVIKIDVEGAEMSVLHGARDVIKQYQPTIYLSVHPRELKQLGFEQDALTSLINGLGYQFFDVDYKKVENFSLDEYVLLPHH